MHFSKDHNPLIVLNISYIQRNVDIINIRKQIEKKEIFYNIMEHSIFQHESLIGF